MGGARAGLLILLGLALLAGSMSVFTVDEREKAVMLRLGEIVRADYEPGLHFKVPFVNSVRKFDGRILTLDAPPERYLTSEKKNVIVDSYVKWRIKEVGRYFRATGGDERRAALRISQIIKDGLRSEFGKRTIQEVVSGEREEVMETLVAKANRQVDGLGVEIVDVRVKRIDLPPEVSSSVFRRMEAERERVAREFRSRGQEAAERIRAEADRKRTVILAEAYREAERIRGEGDAIAARIYAEAFRKDPDFYALYRTLAVYRSAFRGKDDVIVLDSRNEFLRYLKGGGGE